MALTDRQALLPVGQALAVAFGSATQDILAGRPRIESAASENAALAATCQATALR
jgi:hypothetical protein